MRKYVRILSLTIGLVVETYLLIELSVDIYQTYFPLLWIVSLVCIGYFFWKKREKKASNFLLIEYFFVSCVTALFLFINLRDLTHWYFSVINDEYAFFFLAKSIASGATVNIFSQEGVYGIIPVLSSYYQGMGMKIFGISNFGWKSSIILFVVSSFIPFYLLVRSFLGSFYASTSLIILSFSHYLWAYLRTGYSNIESVAISIWAMYFFSHGIPKKKSPQSDYRDLFYDQWILFLSGVAAGFGFYTFFSARSTIAIMVIFILCTSYRRQFRRIWIPMLVGFFATISPIVAVSKQQLVLRMIERSSSHPVGTNLTGLRLIVNNIYHSIQAFFVTSNFGPYASGPHVYGSLVDLVTAIFFGIGFICSLQKVNRPWYLLLFIWFWVALLVAGGFSQYAWTNVSRLYYLLPVVAIYASLGVQSVYEFMLPKVKKIHIVQKISNTPYWILHYWTLVMFGLAIGSINVYRFYKVTPFHKPMSSQALTVMELTVGRCSTYPLSQVTVVGTDALVSTAKFAIESYNKQFPPYFTAENIDLLKKDIDTYFCIVFIDPKNFNANLLRQYNILLDEFHMYEDYDPAKINHIEVLERK
ncbi:glycosyltransferase family 39 protein [Candidatus Gottesmanbacteria bacterium]|nr:glycosyltransferase family 39 protein [Candidatus Gottesmanbacteria bacterium]